MPVLVWLPVILEIVGGAAAGLAGFSSRAMEYADALSPLLVGWLVAIFVNQLGRPRSVAYTVAAAVVLPLGAVAAWPLLS